MVITPETTFSGPHANAYRELGSKLLAEYEPLQRAVSGAPTIAVAAQLSAIYQGMAAYELLASDIERAARQENISSAQLRMGFATSVLRQNPIRYLKVTLLNYFGQWSVAAQKVPWVAHELAAYSDSNPAVGDYGKVPVALLRPRPSWVGAVVYPMFLFCGAMTFVLGFGLLLFVFRPSLSQSQAGFYMLLACFLSASCHAYTLFISLVNEWTPRFLMAVFPNIVVAGVFIVLALLCLNARRRVPRKSDNTRFSA
jgi:hypothetical protein